MARAYQQVADELRRRIESGAYSARSPFPSERALEREFDIHRATVRRALGVLAEEGLLARSHGRRALPTPPLITGSQSIGLFAGAPNDFYARSIIVQGMSDFLRQAAPTVGALDSDSYPFRIPPSRQEEKELVLDGLAGAIVWPPRHVNLDRLRQVMRRMPLTLVDMRVAGFESDFVGFQDMEGGYEAAKHLYEIGHRKIAFIGNTQPETADSRFLGVSRFCADAGLPLLWEFAASPGTFPYLPDPMVDALMKSPRDQWPTGVVCSNDTTAAAMISLLGRHGMRVPDDMSLIGFGNAQPEFLDALGLTTMAQPYNQVGFEAVKMIFERLGTSEPPRELRLPMSLVVRRSCGNVAD